MTLCDREWMPPGEENGGHCVYILYRLDTPIYVGKTWNLRARLRTHRKSKDFTSVLINTISGDDAAKLERDVVLAIRPELNKVTPEGRSKRGNAGMIEQINLRVSSQMRSDAQSAAARDGRTLTDWVRRVLLEASASKKKGGKR